MERIASGCQVDLVLLSIENAEDETSELLYHFESSSLLRYIPVIVLANNNEEVRTLCFESNIQAFFTKPFNPLELSRAVDEILQAKNESQILYKKRKEFNLN